MLSQVHLLTLQNPSPVTVGFRPNLLYFNRQLQGEFTTSLLLFHISQQLSGFRSIATIPFLCFICIILYHKYLYLKSPFLPESYIRFIYFNNRFTSWIFFFQFFTYLLFYFIIFFMVLRWNYHIKYNIIIILAWNYP